MDRDTKTLGIVVRSERWGTNDRMLTILSPEKLLRAKVYGARSGKHSLKIPVYTEGTFSLESARQGAPKVKDADVLSYHDCLSSDYSLQVRAALLSELVITSRVAEPALYSLYCHALDAFETEDKDRVSVCFLVHYLALEGLSGDWRTCPVCGRGYGEGEVIGFSLEDSVAACSDCDTMQGVLPLPPNARSYLARAMELPFNEAVGLTVSESQERRVFRYLLRTLRLSCPGKLNTPESVLEDLEMSR